MSAISNPSGNLVLLSSQEASNDASIDFTDIITDAFNTYIIKYESVVPATDNVDFSLRTSNDNGSTFDSGTDYGYHVSKVTDSSLSYAADGNTGNYQINLCDNVGNASGKSISGEITLHNPSNTNTQTLITVNSVFIEKSNLHIYSAGVGCRKAVEAVNAVQFLFSSGNITSGIFKLYGVK